MDHQEAKELFTGYHDGDLTESEQSRLQKHLAHCEDCNAEWKAYQQTMNEVSGLLRMAPPTDTAKAVESKIHRRSKGKFFGRSKSTNIQFALVSFILVLLFMLAYLMMTAVNEIIVLDDSQPVEEEPAAQSTP